MLQDAPALLVASEFFRTAAGSFCIAVFINIALSVDFPIDLLLSTAYTFQKGGRSHEKNIFAGSRHCRQKCCFVV